MEDLFADDLNDWECAQIDMDRWIEEAEDEFYFGDDYDDFI